MDLIKDGSEYKIDGKVPNVKDVKYYWKYIKTFANILLYESIRYNGKDNDWMPETIPIKVDCSEGSMSIDINRKVFEYNVGVMVSLRKDSIYAEHRGINSNNQILYSYLFTDSEIDSAVRKLADISYRNIVSLDISYIISNEIINKCKDIDGITCKNNGSLVLIENNTENIKLYIEYKNNKFNVDLIIINTDSASNNINYLFDVRKNSPEEIVDKIYNICKSKFSILENIDTDKEIVSNILCSRITNISSYKDKYTYINKYSPIIEDITDEWTTLGINDIIVIKMRFENSDEYFKIFIRDKNYSIKSNVINEYIKVEDYKDICEYNSHRLPIQMGTFITDNILEFIESYLRYKFNNLRFKTCVDKLSNMNYDERIGTFMENSLIRSLPNGDKVIIFNKQCIEHNITASIHKNKLVIISNSYTGKEKVFVYDLNEVMHEYNIINCIDMYINRVSIDEDKIMLNKIENIVSNKYIV